MTRGRAAISAIVLTAAVLQVLELIRAPANPIKCVRIADDSPLAVVMHPYIAVPAVTTERAFLHVGSALLVHPNSLKRIVTDRVREHGNPRLFSDLSARDVENYIKVCRSIIRNDKKVEETVPQFNTARQLERRTKSNYLK